MGGATEGVVIGRAMEGVGKEGSFMGEEGKKADIVSILRAVRGG